jgi:hypothetical protein
MNSRNILLWTVADCKRNNRVTYEMLPTVTIFEHLYRYITELYIAELCRHTEDNSGGRFVFNNCFDCADNDNTGNFML